MEKARGVVREHASHDAPGPRHARACCARRRQGLQTATYFINGFKAYGLSGVQGQSPWPYDESDSKPLGIKPWHVDGDVLIRSIGARSMDATVRRFHFELKPNDKLVSLFLPGQLLDPARREAKQAGMPNQPFIRLALERAVQPKAP